MESACDTYQGPFPQQGVQEEPSKHVNESGLAQGQKVLLSRSTLRERATVTKAKRYIYLNNMVGICAGDEELQ